MPQMLFDDLQTKRKVGITLGGTFCGFYEKADDTEVVFRLEEGHAILALLEKSLASYRVGTVDDLGEHILVHRFRNLDGVDEAAAFLIRKKLGGIELTVMSGLDEDDDLAEWTEGGGMSVCISTDDARTLVNAFSSELSPKSDA
jgi:hypothetical protein